MRPARTKPTIRRRAISAVLVLAGVLALPIGCEERPAIEPSKPSVRPAATTAPAGEAIGYPPPEIVALNRALAWTDEEKNILAAVNDGNRQWQETGFFTAMQRVKKIKPLPSEALNLLDQPAYASLMNDPKRHRGRPIRLTVNVAQVDTFRPVRDFALSRRWTRDDGPIWRIVGLSTQAKDPEEQPVQIFCAFDPLSAVSLGEPFETTDDRATYTYEGKEVRQVKVAGAFYKVFREIDRGRGARKPRLQSYPIVLAWQIASARPVPRTSSTDTTAVGIIIIVVVLAAIYIALRRSTKASIGPRDRDRPYRPLRTTETDQDSAERKPTPQDQAEGDIDPLLKAASKQYRKEKGLDNGKDRHGRTGAT